MWYVIVNRTSGAAAYYGAYKDEATANSVKEKVGGAVVYIKDWKSYAKAMNASNE